jgi:hypothetical protein
MKRILASLAIVGLLAASANAVTIYSYNLSYGKPITVKEISRSAPSKPPRINIKVEFGNVCLQLIDVNSGNVIWETCI